MLICSPVHAIGFAIGASTLGLGMLYFGVNGLTCALGATNLILYTCVYTPMKRISILNTWVGSIGKLKFISFFSELKKLFAFSRGFTTCHGLDSLHWRIWCRCFCIGWSSLRLAISTF
jgi:hypothetical protein